MRAKDELGAVHLALGLFCSYKVTSYGHDISCPYQIVFVAINNSQPNHLLAKGNAPSARSRERLPIPLLSGVEGYGIRGLCWE